MPPLNAPGLIPFPRPPDPILPPGASINLGNGAMPPLMDGGAMVHEQPDGCAIVDFNPYAAPKPKTCESKFGDNLALDMDQTKLGQIANELLIGIENDENSRKEALAMLAIGMRQLGFIIEDDAAAIAIPSDTGPTEEIWTRASQTPNFKAVFLEAHEF